MKLFTKKKDEAHKERWAKMMENLAETTAKEAKTLRPALTAPRKFGLYPPTPPVAAGSGWAGRGSWSWEVSALYTRNLVEDINRNVLRPIGHEMVVTNWTVSIDEEVLMVLSGDNMDASVLGNALNRWLDRA